MLLNEIFDQNKTDAAFCFGRFNPCHQGHVEVFKSVQGAGHKWFICTNPETSGPNDPLPFQVKAKWMTAIYPELKGHLLPEMSVMTAAAKIYELLGSDKATLSYVTDSNDWKWAGNLLKQFNGVESKHGFYKFSRIIHVESPRVSSATALREAARANDKKAFYSASGTDPKLKINGLSYFDTVVKYCKLNPEKKKKSK